jgi:hypothetical protein
MKTLKARISHPRKKILKISDLSFNQHYIKNNVPLNQGVDKITDIMEKPIEVFKHKISKTPRMGVGGKPYVEKLYSVHVGGQRVTRAVQLGYTHIEAIIYD